MKRIGTLTKRMGLRLALAVALLALAAGPLAAAPKKSAEDFKAKEQAYLLPYILTFVAIGLGVAVVCFPSQRKSEWETKED